MSAITKNRDILRLQIGDTDMDDVLFMDSELDVFLARYDLTGTGTGGSTSALASAAADAFDALANRFARQFDFSEDGQSFALSQRSAAYRSRALELRRGIGSGYSVNVTSSVNAARDAAAS